MVDGPAGPEAIVHRGVHCWLLSQFVGASELRCGPKAASPILISLNETLSLTAHARSTFTATLAFTGLVPPSNRFEQEQSDGSEKPIAYRRFFFVLPSTPYVR